MKYEKNGKIVYEVGDWVCAIEKNAQGSNLGVDVPQRVKGFRNGGLTLEIDRGYAIDVEFARPATQKEIEKAIKPVFKTKDKYEIGDWVTRTEETFGGMQPGDTGQIIGFTPYPIISRYWTKEEKGHDSKKLRLAIEDEIRQASKFQKGDWVALLKNNQEDVEAVVQLIKVDHNYLYYEPYNRTSFGKWGIEPENTGSVRFATWEEIQKALKDKEIKIGEHTVEFDPARMIIKVGCQSYPYDDVVTLHRIMTKLDIKSITHSKIVGAIWYVTIDKIYNRIKDAGS